MSVSSSRWRVCLSVPVLVVGALCLGQGCADVMTATRDDDRSTLTNLLSDGADPNPGKEGTVTPLAEAIEQNNVELVKILVEGRADLYRTTPCRGVQLPPLHKAAVHGHIEIVNYLLEKGADPMAIAEGDSIFVLMAKLAKEADKKGVTALILGHLQEKFGRETMLAFLNAQTPSGWTALTAAIWFGDKPMMDQLLSNDASTKATAKASNANPLFSDEWPPLYFADVRGRHAFSSALMQAGADPNQKSSTGMSMAQLEEKFAQKALADEARREREANWRRQEEAEEAAERERDRQRGAEYMNKMTQQMTGNPNAEFGKIENPLDDTSFQDKMMKLYREEGVKKAAAAESREQELALARCRDEMVPSPRCQAMLKGAAQQESRGEAETGGSDRGRQGSGHRQASEDAAQAKRDEEKEREREAKEEERRLAREESARKAREEQERRDEQRRRDQTVLAYAKVNERMANGCSRSILVSFDEITLEGNFGSEYNAFRQRIESEYPTGGDTAYVDWETVTTFVKRSEVIVVVKFSKKNGKCMSRLISHATARTYDDAWRIIQRNAAENGWEAVDLIERWPAPEVGDYGD